MRIQQNMDVQNSIIKDQADANSASKSTHKNKNSVTVSGEALNENSPLSQRQSLAKKQALKVVSDAFGGEKNMRAIKNKFSNYTGGLNRVVEVYDVNGQLIKSYKGKFDIEYEDERILFDDEDGNRHIIYFKTGQVIVDEVKGE